MNKILFGIVLLGIAVFLFNIFVLPETSFQDSVFYLNITKGLMHGEALEYPFPVKFYLTAAFFSIVPLPIEQFSKIVPFIISLAYFALLYKISRQLFKKNYLFPLAFALASYWVLNFFTINYNGSLVALFVLVFTYLYLIESKAENNSYLNFGLMLLCILGMALTKMNGLALAPILLFFMFLLYRRKSGTSKFLIPLFLIAVFFAAIFLFYSGQYVLILERVANAYEVATELFLPRIGDYMAYIPSTYLRLLNYPPSECLNLLFFGLLNEPLKLLFIIITFPFFLLCVAGIVRGFLNSDLFWKMLSSVVIFNFGIILLQYFSLSPFISPRYLIPTIALAGILATKEYGRIRTPQIKKAVAISFVLFALYTLAYSGYSTYYHHKTYMLHEPSIQFISTLPEDSNILVSYLGGRVRLYAHRKDVLYTGTAKKGNFIKWLEYKHITHIYIGCYRELIDLNTMQTLLDVNATREIYADKCSRVYEILYYMEVDMELPEMQMPVGIPVADGRIPETYTYRVDECH